MGRYTTVQTFTDSDAKAAISYSAATSSSGSKTSHYGPGNDAPNSSSSSNGASGASADRHGEPKVAINRVDNVSGSTAGAGSGDFHMYRASRRREMERVERMEKEYAERKAREEFERKRLLNMTEFEARAHKRAEKRRRRKERTKAKSLSNGSDSDAGNASDGEEQPEQKKSKANAADAAASGAPAPAVVPETPGGVPEIPNDGSFLARMLAEQAKQKQSETKTKDE